MRFGIDKRSMFVFRKGNEALFKKPAKMKTYKNFSLKTELATNGMRLAFIYDNNKSIVGIKDTFKDARKAIDNNEIKATHN